MKRLTYRRWSEEETAVLEQCLDRLSIKAIARRLKRSELSVKVKAVRLGYSTQTTLDRYSMRYLAIQLGVDLNSVRWWIQRGYLKAKPNGKRRLSIRAKDFSSFASNYPKISSKFDREVVKWLAGQ